MKLKLSTLLFYFLFLCTAEALNFEPITSSIFQLGDDAGIISAFGHYNSDEFTDLMMIQQFNSGTKLLLLAGNEENKPYFRAELNCSFENLMTGVVPGDFNGDSLLDILLNLYIEEKNHVKIIWGSNGTINCKPETLFTLKNQPLIVDFNGDMIPDVIGENSEDGNRYVWLASMDKNFTNQSLSHLSNQKFRDPHSSGLIDLTGNMVQDMLIMGKHNIELWYNTGNGFIPNGTIEYPKENSQCQSTFVDFDLDGKTNHLMPVCYDSQCKNAAVLIYNENSSEWVKLLDNFVSPDGAQWGFKLPLGFALEMAALPVTLRAGDVDMDGYPDFIVVLQLKNGPMRNRAVILLNVPCHDCFTGRTLKVMWEVPGLKDIQDVQLASFFDLFEDGTLDILVTARTGGEWRSHALRNTDPVRSCFLKVLVLSGLCYRNCTTQPYGVNQPGPIVRYNMKTQDGTPVVSSALQLSQSAHFPLQLPYSIFGLGQTPNFIDELTVSVPARFNGSVHKRAWIQIIPNSQIVVVPNPPNEESRWDKKLFVTPSRLVLLTGVSLLGTCFFLASLVGVLHWKERREDKIEKKQDAFRFHFDAM